MRLLRSLISDEDFKKVKFLIKEKNRYVSFSDLNRTALRLLFEKEGIDRE